MAQSEQHYETSTGEPGARPLPVQPAGSSPGEAERLYLTVVGIGASAGDLAALKTFFQHVPEDSS